MKKYLKPYLLNQPFNKHFLLILHEFYIIFKMYAFLNLNHFYCEVPWVISGVVL